jgi:hypothetical protein
MPFAEAVAACGAPDGPGVYVFLDATAELLYVGKAAHLRRRLRDHARSATTGSAGSGRLRQLYRVVHEIRWEQRPDESQAALREADLIVALRPRFNASHRNDGRWNYVVVAEAGAALELTLSTTAGGQRSHGCFPHLGRGVGSPAGIACSDGYTALLRLLWASTAGPRATMPSLITRSAPDAVVLDVDPVLRRPLHDLLAGTSRRLLGSLAERHLAAPPLLRPALARDQAAAAGFFDHGPRALRRLRRAHGGAPGPLSRPVIEDMLATDLRQAIGPFRLPTPDPPATTHLARQTRPWS